MFQALQIAGLIKDYSNVIQLKRKPTERMWHTPLSYNEVTTVIPDGKLELPSPQGATPMSEPQPPTPVARPVSILYKPPPPLLVGEDFV